MMMRFSATESRLRWSLVTLACALVLSACSDGSTIAFRRDNNVDVDGLTIRLLEGSEGSSVLTAEDFTLQLGLTERTLTPPVPVKGSGRLTIRLELVEEGVLIAEGEASLQLASNFEWGGNIIRADEDPLGLCIGCFASEGFPIADGFQEVPGEGLWLVFSGHPKGDTLIN